MKRLTKNSFILLLLIVANCAVAEQSFKKQRFELNNKIYTLEIAASSAQKSLGLMYRDTLKSDQGMLFSYQRPGHYRIWMKNTLIPLSVLWLDKEGRIKEKKLLQPCASVPCPSYGRHDDIMFIVELSDSEFERFKVGDRLMAIR